MRLWLVINVIIGLGVLPSWSEENSELAIIDFHSPKSGFINGTNVNIRKGPGVNFPIVLQVNKLGTLVTVIAKTKDWYQIKVKDRIGWIYATFLSIDQDESSDSSVESSVQKTNKMLLKKVSKGLVNGDNVNLRENPTIHSKVVGIIRNKGERVDILKGVEDWYLIQRGDIEGWIFGHFLTPDVHELLLKAQKTISGDAISYTGYINTSRVNLREGPTTKSQILSTLPDADVEVEVLAWQDGWYRIKANNVEGWLYGKFLEPSAKIEADMKEVSKSKQVMESVAEQPKDSEPLKVSEPPKKIPPKPPISEKIERALFFVKGMTTANRVNMRSEPSVKSTVVMNIPEKNTPVLIDGFEKGWFHITIDNKQGWIYETLVIVQQTNQDDTMKMLLHGITTGERVNLRKGPGTQHEKVVQVSEIGTRLPILSYENGWFQVMKDQQPLWISGTFVTIEKQDIPVAEAKIEPEQPPIPKPRLAPSLEPKPKPKVVTHDRKDYELGLIAYQEKDYQRAKDYFAKAVAAKPDNPYYNFALGKTFIKLDFYKIAEKNILKAQAIKPTLPGIDYTLAYLAYKNKNYDIAAQRMQSILKTNPDHVMANYYAGMSLFQMKQHEKAISYFMGASQKSSSIKTNAWFYAALCEIKINRYQIAKDKLAYVIQHDQTGKLKPIAEKWLAAIESQKGPIKRYHLFLSTGYLIDNNVMLEPNDDEERYSDESDSAIQVHLNGKYNFIHTPSYQMGIGLTHYQVAYFDLTEYNLAHTQGALYGNYLKNPFKISLSYLPSYSWLDGESFLSKHKFQSDISWALNAMLKTKLTYTYSINNHFFDEEKDGHTHDADMTGYIKIGKSVGQLFGGFGFSDTATSHLDFDYQALKAKIGMSFFLPYHVNLSLLGTYYDKEYDNQDSLYEKIRTDTRYSGYFGLSIPLINDHMTMNLWTDYIDNDSNFTPYQFKKCRVGINAEGSF